MQLAERGADVIFEAGGPTGACGLVAASHDPRVAAVVGVDVDRALHPASCLGSTLVSGLAT